MVIPIIPDKNDKNIVIAIKIPILAFSLVFRTIPINKPKLIPATQPVNAKSITFFKSSP